MAFSQILKRTERVITDNSPAILTGLGVAGVVATVYFTGRATVKAVRILDAEKNWHVLERREFTPQDKVKRVWKLYIPAATTGLLTVSCIIAANRIGSRRAAAIAAAYTLAERGFEQYREKVIEKIGERKEELVRADIAQDRLNENPPPSREVIILGSGEVLFLEAFTGRYFMSDIETLRSAANQVNEAIINGEQSFSLSEFYDLVGLKHTSESDYIGWNLDRMCKLSFSSAIANDGRACMSLEYSVIPQRGYNTIH